MVKYNISDSFVYHTDGLFMARINAFGRTQLVPFSLLTLIIIGFTLGSLTIINISESCFTFTYSRLGCVRIGVLNI